MDNIILYSTHCTKCNVLEKKLIGNNFNFILNDTFDVNYLIEKGYSSAPVMEVNGELMDFNKANKWINEKIEENKGGK